MERRVASWNSVQFRAGITNSVRLLNESNVDVTIDDDALRPFHGLLAVLQVDLQTAQESFVSGRDRIHCCWNATDGTQVWQDVPERQPAVVGLTPLVFLQVDRFLARVGNS